jgi:hypothetical protein
MTSTGDEETTEQGPPPPPTPPPPYALQPHRGPTVLVLGIIGIAMCFICGIIAWVMGNNDLDDMDAGRGLTQAGRICGIVGVAWWGLWIVLYVAFIALMVAVGGLHELD